MSEQGKGLVHPRMITQEFRNAFSAFAVGLNVAVFALFGSPLRWANLALAVLNLWAIFFVPPVLKIYQGSRIDDMENEIGTSPSEVS